MRAHLWHALKVAFAEQTQGWRKATVHLVLLAQHVSPAALNPPIAGRVPSAQACPRAPVLRARPAHIKTNGSPLHASSAHLVPFARRARVQHCHVRAGAFQVPQAWHTPTIVQFAQKAPSARRAPSRLRCVCPGILLTRRASQNAFRALQARIKSSAALQRVSRALEDDSALKALRHQCRAQVDRTPTRRGSRARRCARQWVSTSGHPSAARCPSHALA